LKVGSELQYKTSLGKLFRMKDAEYEYERLANSVFILGIVSSGSAVDRNTLDCNQSNVYSSRIIFWTICQDLLFCSFSL